MGKAGFASRTLHWLLQSEKPVADRTEAELAAQIARDYRWNFTVNVLEGAAFWFGFSFASTSTILPLFVSKLTPSPHSAAIRLNAASRGAWSRLSSGL